MRVSESVWESELRVLKIRRISVERRKRDGELEGEEPVIYSSTRKAKRSPGNRF